eukprot:GHRQ01021291.1.p3 GENE.GHRQ01021291.1~~GHRQ01021291.1.p3  ORF type:complete len:118 (-),score=46.42 GHRQ01021291.1:475-828(-)
MSVCLPLQYGNGTLRLTTRQAYQLHGVLKHDLKTVFSTVIKNMGSTLGACGDVNRNVMGPAAPFVNKPEYALAQKVRATACCTCKLLPGIAGKAAQCIAVFQGCKHAAAVTMQPRLQ